MFILTIVIMLILGGMGTALLGSIKLELVKRLSISESQFARLISSFGFITIPMILIGGLAGDHYGRSGVAILGMTLFVLGLLLLQSSAHFRVALIAILILGSGWALIANITNCLMVIAFNDGTEQALTKSTNLGNFFYGLGAFLTPLIYNLIAKRFGFRGLIQGMLSVGVVVLVLLLMLDIPTNTTQTTVNNEILAPFWQSPILWICAIGLFCYGPIEASLAGWGTSLLIQKGSTEKQANRGLTSFWLCYMLSRLGTALFLTTLLSGLKLSWSNESVILIIFTLTLMVALLILLNSSGCKAMLSLPLLGLAIGPIFPTLFSILLDHTPVANHGSVTGLFFGIGNLGWTFIPMALGKQAEKKGLNQAFKIILAVAGGFLFITMILTYLYGQKS